MNELSILDLETLTKAFAEEQRTLNAQIANPNQETGSQWVEAMKLSVQLLGQYAPALLQTAQESQDSQEKIQKWFERYPQSYEKLPTDLLGMVEILLSSDVYHRHALGKIGGLELDVQRLEHDKNLLRDLLKKAGIDPNENRSPKSEVIPEGLPDQHRELPDDEDPPKHRVNTVR